MENHNAFATYLVLMSTILLVTFALSQDPGSLEFYLLVVVVIIFAGWVLKRRNIL